jgi:hypothetical protein
VTAKKATPAKKTAVARKKAAAPPKPTTEEVKTALAVLEAAKVGTTWVYEEVVRMLPLEERPPSVDVGSVEVTIAGPDATWTKAQTVAVNRAIRAAWPELKVTAGKAEFTITVTGDWQY